MVTSSNPGSPASHPAPCSWPGKAAEDGPTVCDLALMWEPRKKLLAPGSWLRISSVAVTWGVNHWAEDLPLCLSSSLYLYLTL